MNSLLGKSPCEFNFIIDITPNSDFNPKPNINPNPNRKIQQGDFSEREFTGGIAQGEFSGHPLKYVLVILFIFLYLIYRNVLNNHPLSLINAPSNKRHAPFSHNFLYNLFSIPLQLCLLKMCFPQISCAKIIKIWDNRIKENYDAFYYICLLCSYLKISSYYTIELKISKTVFDVMKVNDKIMKMYEIYEKCCNECFE